MRGATYPKLNWFEMQSVECASLIFIGYAEANVSKDQS